MADIIKVEHLSYVYNPGLPTAVTALDDVSFTVEEGDFVGIIGATGSGKSTLITHMNGLNKPTSGKIYIDGRDLWADPEKIRDFRFLTGLVFQYPEYQLFEETCYKDIAFGPKNMGLDEAEVDRRVHEAADFVGLDPALLERSPFELSGGQKQRAAIARALASDPEILLCDEATSALDPQTTEAILKLLKSLNAKLGLTIVLITHQMNVVKEICDRTAVMENGRVVEQGDVFEIFANPQQPVTPAFVDTTSCLSGINTLIEEKSPLVQLKPGQKILRFKYLERSACEALVSTISRKFNVDLNIVFGSIEIIGDNPIGGLVVIADGNEDDIRAAVKYLCDINVGVEVILSA